MKPLAAHSLRTISGSYILSLFAKVLNEAKYSPPNYNH